MTNMKWFLTCSEAKEFARKVNGTVFKFTKKEMQTLKTNCEFYVRWTYD